MYPLATHANCSSLGLDELPRSRRSGMTVALDTGGAWCIQFKPVQGCFCCSDTVTIGLDSPQSCVAHGETDWAAAAAGTSAKSNVTTSFISPPYEYRAHRTARSHIATMPTVCLLKKYGTPVNVDGYFHRRVERLAHTPDQSHQSRGLRLLRLTTPRSLMKSASRTASRPTTNADAGNRRDTRAAMPIAASAAAGVVG